ncbi:hypothetical protein Ahy_B01g055934 [Arachis hypogaea]|uniref:Uncharacterized protein n=1 Tax=Arachis hypogaea TaxID=3818 RepID=A0A445AXH8_ARAHY|nr:hypothetical protein Ahy_B01g055934 [Arachis hypogaea]
MRSDVDNSSSTGRQKHPPPEEKGSAMNLSSEVGWWLGMEEGLGLELKRPRLEAFGFEPMLQPWFWLHGIYIFLYETITKSKFEVLSSEEPIHERISRNVASALASLK